MISKAIIFTSRNGASALINAGRSQPAMLSAVSRQIPRGGVSRPMLRFSIMITEKCRGWMPTLVAAAISRGENRMIAAAVSMNMPAINKNTFRNTRLVTADMSAETRKAFNRSGTRSTARIQESIAPHPTSIISCDENTIAREKIPGRLSSLSVRYRSRVMSRV